MDKVIRKGQQVSHSQKPTTSGQRGVDAKESNITNFYYQQKKRHMDTGQDSSSLKKSRRSAELTTSTHPDQPIIAWESPRNTSVDCQLKLSESIGLQNSQQDSSQIARRNECKMDQILNEFHAKLQFEGLSREGEDSGNSESDEISDDDSWLAKNLHELDQIAAKPTASASINSRESGIGSCDSSVDKPESNRTNSNQGEGLRSPGTKLNLFKVPETPNKPNLIKPPTTNSIQFFSTPKTVTRQRSMNQSLNFENLSPIRSNCIDNNLINLKADNKRALNDSLSEDASAVSKRRNGKVLFKSVDENRPVGAAIELNKAIKPSKVARTEDSFDDSFDQILSQLDDKAILTEPKRPKIVPVKTQPVRTQPTRTQPVGMQPVGMQPARAQPSATQPTRMQSIVANNQFEVFDEDDSFDNLLSQLDNQTLMKLPEVNAQTGRATANQLNVHLNSQLHRQTNQMGGRIDNQRNNQMNNQIRSQPANKTSVPMRLNQPMRPISSQMGSQTGRPINQVNGSTIQTRALNSQTNRVNSLANQAYPPGGAFRYSVNSQILN